MNREKLKKILDENNIKYNKLIGINKSFDIEVNKEQHFNNNYKEIRKISKCSKWFLIETKYIINWEF